LARQTDREVPAQCGNSLLSTIKNLVTLALAVYLPPVAKSDPLIVPHWKGQTALSVPKNAGRRVLYETAMRCRHWFCRGRPSFRAGSFSVFAIQIDALLNLRRISCMRVVVAHWIVTVRPDIPFGQRPVKLVSEKRFE